MEKGTDKSEVVRVEIPAYLAKPVGQIMVKWAYLEYRLSMVIWNILGVSEEVGRLAVSDPRAQQKFELIRDLLHLRGHEMDEAKYKEAYASIEEIQGLRDLAAHGLWTLSEGRWHVLKFSGKVEDQSLHKVERKRRFRPEAFEATPQGLAPIIDGIINLIKATDSLDKIVASLDKSLKQSAKIGRKVPARKR